MPPAVPPKVVLVTGASAGIGAALARELASRGHHLALTARRGDRLQALADGLLAEDKARGAARPPIEVHVIPADLSDASAFDPIIGATLERFGRLDVLINNAGFGLPSLFADSEPTEVRRQVEVNLVAPLLLTRAALPHLLAHRGTIINIGSAITSVPNSALGAYGATKAGLAYWNDALRRELRHKGLKVCLVEPGPVHTEFFSAIERLIRPGGEYHPMLDAPAPWMSAQVDDVARRIVDLIDSPKRRLSVRRRVVWPFRLLGGVFRAWPALGDVAFTTMARHFERLEENSRLVGSPGDARPTE